jgi:hypothetical protein
MIDLHICKKLTVMLVNGRPDGRPRSGRVTWRHGPHTSSLSPTAAFFRPDFFGNRLLSPLNPAAPGTRVVGELTTPGPQRAEDGGGRRAPRPPMDGGAPPQRSHGRDGEEKATMDPSVAPPRSGLDPVARSCGQGLISPAARHRAPLRLELPALRLPPSVATNLGSHHQAGRP